MIFAKLRLFLVIFFFGKSFYSLITSDKLTPTSLESILVAMFSICLAIGVSICGRFLGSDKFFILALLAAVAV